MPRPSRASTCSCEVEPVRLGLASQVSVVGRDWKHGFEYGSWIARPDASTWGRTASLRTRARGASRHQAGLAASSQDAARRSLYRAVEFPFDHASGSANKTFTSLPFPDQVNHSAQPGRYMPTSRIIERQALKRRCPFIQYANQ